MNKVSARLVPHQLTPEKAECRQTIANYLLLRLNAEGQNSIENNCNRRDMAKTLWANNEKTICQMACSNLTQASKGRLSN